MLQVIGASDIAELFDEIPDVLRNRASHEAVPEGLGEMEVARLMRERAARDDQPLCFLGAGAYRRHIPAAVWELAGRGEFMTAYTPYQAEASQGTLQVLYEYQTMMAGLTGMDASNASLYDGASALGEAVLMAVRANRKSKSKKILIPETVSPVYRQVVRALTTGQGIVVEEVPFDPETGRVDRLALEGHAGGDLTALVIPQPNYFGVLEEVDALTDWAKESGALVIGLVDPVAMALLTPPGEWGRGGADIACGDGQPLGAPLASGGPYFGFLTTKTAHLRQLPGRIVGRTLDKEGKPGFTLTLQAREQHIRRSRATSNICTNQGLLTTAAAIHMALLGPQGLKNVALASHENTVALTDSLITIDGVSAAFTGPFLYERVLVLDRPVRYILGLLREKGILGGLALRGGYPDLKKGLLVCATETKSPADLAAYTEAMKAAMETGGAGQ